VSGPPVQGIPEPRPEGRGRNLLGPALLLALVALLVAAGYWIAPHVTRDNVERWVREAGVAGPFVLLAIQIAQILIAPIPGVFVPLVAGLLYGPVIGPIVTVLGTLIGSMLAYWLGRRAGRPLAERWIGRGPVEKANALIRGKRWVALVPLFLLPLSPSDALCFMAGILAMDWRRFTLAVLVGRLPKDALLALGAALGWGALFGFWPGGRA
jgi:uncharacterized membrane protein YdjX (TVP38/TMEM64 family)